MQIDFESEYNKHYIVARWNWSGNEKDREIPEDILRMVTCGDAGDVPSCLYMNKKASRQLNNLGADRKSFREHVQKMTQGYGKAIEIIVSEDVPDNRVIMMFLDGSMVGLNTEPHHFLTSSNLVSGA